MARRRMSDDEYDAYMDRPPSKSGVYRCGGPLSYYGSCGALDCVTCYGFAAYEYVEEREGGEDNQND